MNAPLLPVPTRVVGLASVLVDLTLDVPYVPASGHDVVATPVTTAPGGGVNVLCAAARLGLPAVYAGGHGTGPMGTLVRQALAADGIGALRGPDPTGDSGYCLALVEPGGERTFVTVPGVESRVRPDDLAGARPAPGDVLYASGYDLVYPQARAALCALLTGVPGRGGAVREAPGRSWSVLDPGPLLAPAVAAADADDLRAVLRCIDLLTLSRAEHEAFGGDAALGRLLAPGALVLLRRGADGAVLQQVAPDGTVPVVAEAPAAVPPGPVVDTNGAGDTHLGAFLATLATGADAGTALDAANRAAAWTITRRGAATGPTPHELMSV